MEKLSGCAVGDGDISLTGSYHRPLFCGHPHLLKQLKEHPMAKAPRAKAAAKAPAGPTNPELARAEKALAAAQTAMEADRARVATAKKRVLAAQVKARGSARKTDKNALVAARAALRKASEKVRGTRGSSLRRRQLCGRRRPRPR